MFTRDPIAKAELRELSVRAPLWTTKGDRVVAFCGSFCTLPASIVSADIVSVDA